MCKSKKDEGGRMKDEGEKKSRKLNVESQRRILLFTLSQKITTPTNNTLKSGARA
jgi:hypothetical protein